MADLEREDAPIGGTNGGKSSGKRKKSGPAEKVTVSTVHRCDFILNIMDFILKLTDFILKMMDFTLKIMNFSFTN